MLVNVYVDGFNLYYGCLKGTPYKWLDLDALSRRLLPRDRIHRIRYFTAQIGRRPDDPQRHNRQQYYLRALATIPHLDLHLGRFQETTTRMRLANPPAQGPCTVKVIKTEEKGSDVNLATYLLADAFRRNFETALVITNDADLAEPIRLVCHELGLPVGIANPHPPYKRSVALERTTPTFFKQIRPGALRDCQFPDTMRDQHGQVRRPVKW
ncbi:NYN domain-containing protein [Actinomadura alba]|uniref:NYN domain-containing protein n=1 Tax=Actinomadura alba TaxID=406431 RepID=A0ABR7LW25_9ACTN|nr:NYN domain-containing protein [Actinomadura alba]MBC6468628.1 NYN domain-containing protein [Actinomadura alba]